MLLTKLPKTRVETKSLVISVTHVVEKQRMGDRVMSSQALLMHVGRERWCGHIQQTSYCN